jgi:uracil-DNA glycosylase
MNKDAPLLALAKLRQATQWPGYKSIADYGNGAYECDFVSPYTKTAGNVDAEVMVLLQDWSSDEELSRGLDESTRRLGYTPTQPTSCNLERLLKNHFGLSLSNIYGTNLFPFVKPGAVSSPIPDRDLIRAAREFALPQIGIVSPRLVICLGLVTFDALRRAYDLPRAGKMDSAINSPFTVGSSRVWCQAHTGALGQMNRNKGGVDRVSQDWMRMKEDLNSTTAPIR